MIEEQKNKSKEIEIVKNKIELMKVTVTTEVIESQNKIDEYNKKINNIRKNNDEQQKCNEKLATESLEQKQTLSDLISKTEQHKLESMNIMEKRNKIAETTREEIKSLLNQVEKNHTKCNDVQITWENKKRELEIEAKEKINKAVAATNKYKEKISILHEKNEEKCKNQISKHEDELKKLELQISELKTSKDNLEKEMIQVNQELSVCSKIILSQSNATKVEEIPDSSKIISRKSNLRKVKKIQPSKEKEPDVQVKKIPFASSQITVNSTKSDKTDINFTVPQKPNESRNSSTKKRFMSMWDTEESSEGEIGYTPKQAKTTTNPKINKKF